MKVRAQNDDSTPIKGVQNAKQGQLYIYTFPDRDGRKSVYVICTHGGAGKPMFVDLEDGGWYYGDRGELRLMRRAELVIGDPK